MNTVMPLSIHTMENAKYGPSDFHRKAVLEIYLTFSGTEIMAVQFLHTSVHAWQLDNFVCTLGSCIASCWRSYHSLKILNSVLNAELTFSVYNDYDLGF